MTGDKLTIVNWIERGDDVVIKRMRTVPSGFRERDEETTKVFVAYDKALEIVKKAWVECGRRYGEIDEVRAAMITAKGIYEAIESLKGKGGAE